MKFNYFHDAAVGGFNLSTIANQCYIFCVGQTSVILLRGCGCNQQKKQWASD